MDEAVFLHPPVPDGFNVKAPGGGKKYKGGATPPLLYTMDEVLSVV